MESSTTAASPSREGSPEIESEKELEKPQMDNGENNSVQVDKEQHKDAASQEEPEWSADTKVVAIMGVLCLVCFLMLLDVSIIVTAIPRITNDFRSLPDVGWYGAAYQLASAALVPLTGKLFTHFSTKWTFLAFFGIFELGSLLCGVATSSKMFIVGRAVAGLGSSGIQNGAFTIIAAIIPMHKRPSMIGIAIGVSQLGVVIGPLVGGLLTEYTTWRWCFYVNLPIGGVVTAIILMVSIPEQYSKPKPIEVLRTLPEKLDLVGFAIFAPASILLLLALQYGGNQYSWDSSVVIGLFCGSGVLFILFIIWDIYKGDAAMIPISMVSKRTVWASCINYGFLMVQVFNAAYYLPIYFQGVKDVSPTLSGVYMLPSILSQLFMAVASGKAVEKVGYYIPFSLVSAVMLSISNGLISTFKPGTSTGKWIGYQIILGAGRGLGLQMPIIAVQNNLQPNQIPTAMALITFSQTFGGSLFLSFADTIFTNSLKNTIPQYAPSVDPEVVINAGATRFRKFISGPALVQVLKAYAKSVDRTFYLGAGAGVVCFAFAFGMGWQDIRKKKQVSKV